MAKMYCSACGQGTTYLDSKPKFCSQCSHPFTQINLPSTSSSHKTFKSKPKPIEIEYEDEEESEKINSSNVPKLEFETFDNLRNRVSLKQLGADKSPKQESIREIPKKKKKFKDFEREWAEELKSSRGKKVDIDE